MIAKSKANGLCSSAAKGLISSVLIITGSDQCLVAAQFPIIIDKTMTIQIRVNLPKRSYVPGLLNISDGVAGLINVYLQIYQSIPEAVVDLIVFAAEQIIQSETESQDQDQLTNELEIIVADGTEDNVDED
ncbi:MAG: hypothetical protein EZS28_012303 [Streblomastix strix]|uniref:Uncharacterized protein n=1 Tax=Streblomastix strix TaxID=222440 RepID=A0A5J4WB59_9EUKA|nr:MAG: hypothetical protein EZS28_012303 [Streblomastix strix]